MPSSLPVDCDIEKDSSVLSLAHGPNAASQSFDKPDLPAQAPYEFSSRQRAALSRMGQSVLSSLDLEQVLKQVVDEVSALLPTYEISILLREKQELVFAAVSGRAARALQGHRMPIDVGIAGQVMLKGEPLRVSGAEADAQMYRGIELLTDYWPGSLLAVPLKRGSQVLGVLEAVHTQVDAFGEQDLFVLDAAANWAAIALANAQQHEELKRRLREARAMADINLALSETLDLDQIFERIIRAAQEIIPNLSQVVIHLLQEPDQGLQPVAVATPDRSHENGFRMHLGEGIAGQVLASGLPMNVGDVQSEPRYLAHGLPTHSLLVVPLQSGEYPLGTLSVQSSLPNAFSSEDEYLLRHLGIQAAIAIANARLFDEVRAGREQLQVLSRQLLETQEAERRFVVQELYGEIGQELSALKMNLLVLLQSSEGASLASRLEESVALAECALDRIRAMSLDLHPALLDDLGLAAALRSLLDEQARRGGFIGEFVAEGWQERRTPQLELVCYRVVQEALTNIMRHAHAQHVLLQIQAHAMELNLVVRDNGLGFDVAAARRRALQGQCLGLLGLEERVLLAGGQLEIESALGYGTELRARFPIVSLSPPQH